MNRGYGRYWNDEGVIIRTIDFGEMDRIAVVFTKRKGKVSAMVRGARKSGNRFGAALDPGTFISMQLYRGKGMAHITQAEIQTSCRKLLCESPRWSVASYCLNLIADCYESESPDAALYEEIYAVFDLLAQNGNWQVLLIKFRLDLLGFLGVRPNMNRCAVCGSWKDRELSSWSVHSGGLVCGICAIHDKEIRPFMPDLRLLLKRIELLPVKESLKIRFSDRQFSDLDRLLTGYYNYHLEKKIPDWVSYSQRFPL